MEIKWGTSGPKFFFQSQERYPFSRLLFPYQTRSKYAHAWSYHIYPTTHKNMQTIRKTLILPLTELATSVAVSYIGPLVLMYSLKHGYILCTHQIVATSSIYWTFAMAHIVSIFSCNPPNNATSKVLLLRLFYGPRNWGTEGVRIWWRVEQGLKVGMGFCTSWVPSESTTNTYKVTSSQLLIRVSTPWDE